MHSAMLPCAHGAVSIRGTDNIHSDKKFQQETKMTIAIHTQKCRIVIGECPTIIIMHTNVIDPGYLRMNFKACRECLRQQPHFTCGLENSKVMPSRAGYRKADIHPVQGI
jgi:hypothetical protein